MFVTSAIRIALKGHLKDKKLLLLAVTENPLVDLVKNKIKCTIRFIIYFDPIQDRVGGNNLETNDYLTRESYLFAGTTSEVRSSSHHFVNQYIRYAN
jgi:hypothetical protein